MPTVIALYQLCVILIDLLQDNTSSDFNDLGRQLIGGFVAAVIIAVAFAFIKLRMREKNPPTPFISITASKDADEVSKGVND
jgi:high-affinity Fe2+/Pb2+ permease